MVVSEIKVEAKLMFLPSESPGKVLPSEKIYDWEF